MKQMFCSGGYPALFTIQELKGQIYKKNTEEQLALPQPSPHSNPGMVPNHPRSTATPRAAQ